MAEAHGMAAEIRSDRNWRSSTPTLRRSTKNSPFGRRFRKWFVTQLPHRESIKANGRAASHAKPEPSSWRSRWPDYRKAHSEQSWQSSSGEDRPEYGLENLCRQWPEARLAEIIATGNQAAIVG